VYDHLLTLHLEVKHIWSRRLNVVVALYYFMRYFTYVEFILIDYRLSFLFKFVRNEHSPLLHARPLQTICVLMLTIAILALKVWAIWERDRRLTYALPIMFATITFASLVNLAFFLKSLQCKRNSNLTLARHATEQKLFAIDILPNHVVLGCLLESVSNKLSLSWMCFMLCDTTVFVLLLVRTQVL
ncbi:hypothetical protein AMATHDRAFT_148369, partial [Amanita thiersii Skay4041]